MGSINIEFNQNTIKDITADAILILYCNKFEDIVSKEGRVMLPACLADVANT